MEISEVVAIGVLDRFNYNVPMGDGEGYSSSDRMRVMYAPNGRGKTNMLSALGNLLSATPEAFVALSEAPLKKLDVNFAGGARVAFRKAEVFEPTYELEVIDGEGEQVTATVEPDGLARRPAHRVYRDNPDLKRVRDAINSLHPGAIWIGADRLNPASSEDIDDRYPRRLGERYSTARRDVLAELLEQIERMFSNSALKTVARDQNQVYGKLTRTLLTGGSRARSTASQAREHLENRIQDLISRGEGSAKYDLLSLSELRGIRDQLAGVRQNKQELRTLQTILEPYFEILEKQIFAMEPTRHSVEAFVSSVNIFLDDKSVAFTSGEGIALHGHTGLELSPSALSSGERHILLLLAQSVVAADQRKLLIIDEPEISLGIDWQRHLLVNLLKCSSSIRPAPQVQNAQLLVATHSLQVMGEVDPVDIVSVIEGEFYELDSPGLDSGAEGDSVGHDA